MLLVTVGLVCAIAFTPASAEEVSEHLMTQINGTQISGYVSTSMSWLAPGPVRPFPFNPGPIYHFERPIGEIPVRPLRLPGEIPPSFEVIFVPPLRGPNPNPPRPTYPGPRMRGMGPELSALTVSAPFIPRAPGDFQLAAVPEPATMSLAGAGLLAWTVGRWRKKQKLTRA